MHFASAAFGVACVDARAGPPGNSGSGELPNFRWHPVAEVKQVSARSACTKAGVHQGFGVCEKSNAGIQHGGYTLVLRDVLAVNQVPGMGLADTLLKGIGIPDMCVIFTTKRNSSATFGLLPPLVPPEIVTPIVATFLATLSLLCQDSPPRLSGMFMANFVTSASWPRKTRKKALSTPSSIG